MYLKRLSRKWVLTGDVIKDLSLPNLKNEEFKLIPKNEKSPIYSVRPYNKTNYYVYVSHECDFNEYKRDFFLVAPLIKIGPNIKNNEEEFDKLIKSNDVLAHPHYLNYFYYEHNPIIGADFFLDFTRIQNIHSNMKDELIKNKCLQLTLESRTLLKNKIGYYFYHSH